jgi:hypothetical protein
MCENGKQGGRLSDRWSNYSAITDGGVMLPKGMRMVREDGERWVSWLTNGAKTLTSVWAACGLRGADAAASLELLVTWLILPVVICLSQRLSHACLSINKFVL